MSDLDALPVDLYSAAACRELDRISIEQYEIAGYELMCRAGQAILDRLQEKYHLTQRIIVCCGAGNNAGDGYVLARLAMQAGYKVEVVSLVDPKKLNGDAARAYKDWKSMGHQLSDFNSKLMHRSDVIVDALLGTGLEREVEGAWREVIEEMNQSAVPVISVDIPSGLSADTGTVMGVAVKADMTISFIGLKKGLFTHQAADYCGEIFFDSLSVPEEVYKQVAADAQLLHWSLLQDWIKPRQHDSHKGQFGHVLVVGGNYGMAGAVRLSAEAALRTGAGLVSVITRPEHVSAVLAGRPEVMVHGTNELIPQHLLHKADVIIIGPGLGRDDWANRLLGQVLETNSPKVIDADALGLLAQVEDVRDHNWVLTPHPGEAARLLDEIAEIIQKERFSACELIQQQYGGTVVLKGAGSLINSSQTPVKVCAYGNPGMASAGMGDVLSGLIGALIAQGLPLAVAAELAVLVHASAGDRAAESGQRGLLASDLFDSIRSLLNPECTQD
ncbi:MAG: NAD(P)H-hydrate dehydratase [Gammaproteobacteria bacterium]